MLLLRSVTEIPRYSSDDRRAFLDIEHLQARCLATGLEKAEMKGRPSSRR